MASSIRVAATVGQMDTGGQPWTTPENVSVNNTSAASCDAPAKNETCDALVPFNFVVPSPNVDNNDIVGIQGIEFRITRNMSGTSASDLTVSLGQVVNNQVTLVGTNKAKPDAYTGTVETIVYGGPTDLWTLTQAEADLLIGTQAINPNLALYFLPQVDRATVNVQYIELVIYYSIRKMFVFKNSEWIPCSAKVFKGGSWVESTASVFKTNQFINVDKS